MTAVVPLAEERPVAVVLVNWKGWRDTLECVSSLLRIEHPALHVIIVDNGSPNNSVEMMERWCRGQEEAPIQRSITGIEPVVTAPRDLQWSVIADGEPMPCPRPEILIVRSARNNGFAGGNNIGIRLALEAGTDFVWLLNTDTVVAPDALDCLLTRASLRPDAGMIGSSLIYYWRPEQVQALGGARFDRSTGCAYVIGGESSVRDIPIDPGPVEAEIDYVVGASMLVSRSFLETVGPMCEDYFLYFEEMDWALRAHGRFAMAYAPRSRVFHKVGGSSRREASRASLRYLYRNRLRFMARFFPGSLGLVKRRLVLNFFQNLFRGRWDDVREIAGALLSARRLTSVNLRVPAIK